MPQREQVLQSLKKDIVYDLLVIGGGATGCGVALDAASRGLRVALVEKNDFAEGTSGRSTKLLHGGVRYLESAVKHLDPNQYQLVRDGLRERAILLGIAPHLCHRIPLVTPLYRWLEIPYIFAGLKLYDFLAGSMNIGHSRLMSRSRALESFPMIHASGLKAGVSYFDGQFNDARMAVTLAATAAQSGAAVINHVGVGGLLKNGGRVCGAELVDSLSSQEWSIRAKAVINATGPFADEIRRMDMPDAKSMLKVSSGVHIVLDKRFSPPDTGLLIPKTRDGRVLFIMPWEGQTIVGTTDEPADVSEHPKPTEAEINYLVHYIGRYFDLQFSHSDIKAAWAGLRPLVSDPKSSSTAKLSRDHVIEETPSGMITIAGGKWTTYRKMACDAVDYAVKRFELPQKSGCTTESIPLNGGAFFDPEGAAQLRKAYGLDPVIADHLNRAYGDRSPEVAAIAADGLGHPIAPGYPYLEAEVVWGVRHEMASRPMDILARRTPLALLDTKAAVSASDMVVEIMAGELGWNLEKQREEERDVRERLSSAI